MKTILVAEFKIDRSFIYYVSSITSQKLERNVNTLKLLKSQNCVLFCN